MQYEAFSRFMQSMMNAMFDCTVGYFRLLLHSTVTFVESTHNSVIFSRVEDVVAAPPAERETTKGDYSMVPCLGHSV